MRNKKGLEKGSQQISAKIPTYILHTSAKNKDNIKCFFLSNDNKQKGLNLKICGFLTCSSS